MTSFAARERTLLCAEAVQRGPDAPTLCGDWTVKELVVHLLVRERSPAAVGIAVPPLSRVTELASKRLARRDFESLITQLRHGPPAYSPFAVPKLGHRLNTLEYFVHHEDIRRAQPHWQARVLTSGEQSALWSAISYSGRGLVRKAPVAVVAERSDTGQRSTWKGRASDGHGEVVLRGLPSEIALFGFGRTAVADVELVGEPSDVSALVGTELGI